jgi:hypothetical protein
LPRWVKWRSLLPDSIDASHSFQQPIGERSIALFTVGSKKEAKSSSMFFKLHAENHWTPIMTLFTTASLAMDGLRMSIGFLRELSPLWSLQSKLGLLDQAFFLPSFNVDVVRKLSANVRLTNSVQWRIADEGGSFSSTIMRGSTEDDNTLGRVTISAAGGLSLSAQHACKWTFMPNTSLELPGSVSSTVSFNPLALRVSVQADVWCLSNKYWAPGLGLMLSFPLASRGAALGQVRFLYRRGKHAVHIPVMVLAGSDEPTTTPLALAVLPLVLYRTVVLLSTPLMRATAVRRARLKRSQEIDAIRAEYERARRECFSMRASVEQRAAAEDAIGGLVIRNAKLGVMRPLSAEEQASDVPLVADVTMPLQNCVRHSELKLAAGPKAGLAGVFDPHPFATAHDRMRLRVEYWFNRRRHEVEVDASDALELPDEAHLVRGGGAAEPRTGA